MRVFGRHIVPDPDVHRLERRTWPARYVVHSVEIGWNECERCCRWHRVWITDDKIWRRLPSGYWGSKLCSRCFRVMLDR